MAERSRGFVLWLTGLSGAGKTTLSEALVPALAARGLRPEPLDGDAVRAALWPELGFTREDRDANVARLAHLASLLTKHGATVIVSAISPYAPARAAAREAIGEGFIEVYVACSEGERVRRDPKGLYKKALAGEIPRFTGISDPYEEPQNPELRIDTDRVGLDEGVKIILGYLERNKWLI